MLFYLSVSNPIMGMNDIIVYLKSLKVEIFESLLVYFIFEFSLLKYEIYLEAYIRING
jgi:hypothetical protein